MLAYFGKVLIFIGLFLILIGSFFLFANKIPFLGRFPGDILIKKEKFVFYFPLTTSLLLSFILSLVLFFLSKFFK